MIDRLRRLTPRGPSVLGLSRVLAWSAGYCAAFLVAYGYPSLPDELPLSRWTAVPKTLLLALRAPLINLMAIGLCELLARGLSRTPTEQRRFAEASAAALFCTAGLKAMLTAIELVGLARGRPSNALVSLLVVTTGLSLAGWFARPLLERGQLRALRPSPIERAIGIALVLGIVTLNVPIVVALVAPETFR